MSPRLIRILDILKRSNERIRATLSLARRNVASSSPMPSAQSFERSGAVSWQESQPTNRMNFDYS